MIGNVITSSTMNVNSTVTVSTISTNSISTNQLSTSILIFNSLSSLTLGGGGAGSTIIGGGPFIRIDVGGTIYKILLYNNT